MARARILPLGYRREWVLLLLLPLLISTENNFKACLFVCFLVSLHSSFFLAREMVIEGFI